MNFNISFGANTAQITQGSIIGFIFWAAAIIATIMIFRKAGREGWEAIIPFYNSYTEYKLFWTPKMFWISLVLKAFIVIGLVPAIVLGMVYGYSVWEASSLSLVIFAVVMTLVGIIGWITIDVKKTQKLAHAFNRRGMFTVGLFFFSTIFRMIIAFGHDKYAGANL